MIQTTRAIVLKIIPYNDNSVIVHLLTAEKGMQGFIANISKSKHAKMHASLLQPLALLEATYNDGKKTTLLRLKEAKSAEPFHSLPYVPHKQSMAFFLAEFIHAAARINETSEDVFEYVWKSILWLDTCKERFSNFHLVFLIHFSHFLGIQPLKESYQENAYFDMESGRFTVLRPLHTHFIQPEGAKFLYRMLRMDYSNMRLFRLSGKTRKQLLEHALTYYRLHLPDFPELKSLQILEEMYGT